MAAVTMVLMLMSAPLYARRGFAACLMSTHVACSQIQASPVLLSRRLSCSFVCARMLSKRAAPEPLRIWSSNLATIAFRTAAAGPLCCALAAESRLASCAHAKMSACAVSQVPHCGCQLKLIPSCCSYEQKPLRSCKPEFRPSTSQVPSGHRWALHWCGSCVKSEPSPEQLRP